MSRVKYVSADLDAFSPRANEHRVVHATIDERTSAARVEALCGQGVDVRFTTNQLGLLMSLSRQTGREHRTRTCRICIDRSLEYDV